ncbi:LamB/YcsF family protein [Ancylobacter novellus DSM 506]|uniref:LamB/YcsF family protein n=1 Tax=Ancylobacter novellus (strain ATCC 8093 / DSM 506 / JCM 20403 / CCM 1077 / IAM 12100 / NBRC 12443 / NCIMB 10456) TaxID=639283 RepID=D7A9V4_ANCN5|nr:LamB/YcsF family protein [Ancylobacter novellus]ADH88880.1 LamB/YcsF family protein [Ancylobacter novellus DSM 506]
MGVVINCDMGEGYGLYSCGDDAGIMPHIQIGNVACGFHAADPVVMSKTVRLAAEHGVAVGAHPSFPDLQGFGRRDMAMGREELSACVLYQIGALKGFLDAAGMKLNHVKPHGALYGAAMRREEVAHAVADAAQVYGVPVVGMAGTLHEKVYRARGLTFISEYYVDLDYDASGALIITREHEARDPAEAARRAVRMLTEGKAVTIDGRDFDMKAETICIHSDTPNAAELARVLKEAVRPWLA